MSYIPTILLIDDNHLINEINRHILENNGFAVLETDNGYEGIEMYMKYEIDLVILNNLMPLLSGKDTFIKLKEIDPDVKILISTGAHTEESEYMLDNGAQGIILKPYSEDDLMLKISTILAEHSFKCMITSCNTSPHSLGL